MTIGLKDIIYLVGYILSLMAFLFSIRNQLKANENEINKALKVLFGERGKLNVVDIDSCKQNRDNVFQAIRRAETVNENILKKIEEINKNIEGLNQKVVVMMTLVKLNQKDLNEKISVERADAN